MKTICIFGASLDTGNMGVTALSKALIYLFNKNSNCQIYLFSPQKGYEAGDRELLGDDGCIISVKNIPYFTLFYKPLSSSLIILYMTALIIRLFPFMKEIFIKRNNFLRLLSEADFVGDIRGGDSFSDIYGLKRYILNATPMNICRLLGIKYTLLPQKYGPFKSSYSKKDARKTFLFSDNIYCRDEKSIKIVHDIINYSSSNEKTKLIPDVAFTLPPIKPKAINIRGDLHIINKKYVGINISGLLWIGGYNQKNMFGLCVNYIDMICQLVKLFVEDLDKDVLLIPHTVPEYMGPNSESDLKASLACLEKNIIGDKKVSLLNGSYDACELKWIISQADFFMGARMHSCIAALSQGVPTIGHAYSDKFAGVFKIAGVEPLVHDLRTMSNDDIIVQTKNLFSKRELYKEKLSMNIPNVKNKVYSVFQNI